jgi:hypothetical protein
MTLVKNALGLMNSRIWTGMACLLLGSPVAAQAQFDCADNKDRTITITKYTGRGGVVDIPYTINKRLVTCIGDAAFKNCTSLTSVKIPSGVTRISSEAFRGCNSLTSVAIPASVTSIGGKAFRFCFRLPGITIPASVTNIEYEAFYHCTRLDSITIPSSVTSIGNAVFGDCRRLTAIMVDADNPAYSSADGVLFDKDKTTLIEYPAGKERSITLPASVTSIGEFNNRTCLTAIMVDPGNVTYSSVDGILFDKNTTRLIQCPGGKDGSITLPKSVASIGDRAFLGCDLLKKILVDAGNASYSSADGVLFDKNKTRLIQCPMGRAGSYTTIPASVTSIEAGAFRNCNKLNSVKIPRGVTSISGETFNECANLNRIEVDGANPAYSSSSEDGVLFDKRKTTLVKYPRGKPGRYTTMPASVTSIGDGAFQKSGLASITIPSSVAGIGDGAFNSCANLADVTIQKGSTSIGNNAFRDCNRLVNVTIPASVASIGKEAFRNCNSLLSITIPASVTSIGDGAFNNCANLRVVDFKGNAPSIGGPKIFDRSDKVGVNYPKGATGWGPTFGGRTTVASKK